MAIGGSSETFVWASAMPSLLRIIRCELWLLASSPHGRAALLVVALIGGTGVLVPPLVIGTPAMLGAQALPLGALVGSCVALVVGPAAVVARSGSDFDGGMRRVRYVSGCPPLLLSVAQLAACLLACCVAIGTTTLAAMVAAGSDVLVRGWSGARAGALADGLWPSWVPVAGAALLATVVAWCVVHALASGTRGAAVLTAVVVTWFVLLAVVRTTDARTLLVLHPMAALWEAVGPSRSPRLQVDAPSWAFVASWLGWSAAMVAGAWRGLRRP